LAPIIKTALSLRAFARRLDDLKQHGLRRLP